MIDRSRTIARLQFLGGQRIELGNEIVTPDAERLFAMIVRLSVPLGRIASRQTMMDTLWPGADDANARHNLRQTVYKAREIGLVVESGEDGLRLDPRHWSADWEDADGDVPGEWLPHYSPDFSEELKSWITSQRTGVHAMLRPRMIRLLQSARSSGDLTRANAFASQLLSLDSLNEEATLTRAEVMALQGAKVDALKLLDAYLMEIGRLGSGKDAALPAQLLRRRIAEKLPSLSYQSAGEHHGPLIGRATEAKKLIAGLFDARAGRGKAVLIHGPEGCGKTRLLYEVKKSAILQGVRILELSFTDGPRLTPHSALGVIVGRLLDMPGCMGVTPESLARLREWLATHESVSVECPLFDIEDLLAAVSEETSMLLVLEHGELMDPASLASLDRIYRKGVPRYHTLAIASSTRATPTHLPVDVQWIERMPLRPLSTAESHEIVTAFATAEYPRATQAQIACAAVFSEGVPMYGIEMLGLILDAGSPDTIPWRVQVSIEKAIREFNELHWRILALCGVFRESAPEQTILSALQRDTTEVASAIDDLEQSGYVLCTDGYIAASTLLSSAADKRLKASVKRIDARAAAVGTTLRWKNERRPADLYASLRLLVAASDEQGARDLLGAEAGHLVRIETAQSLVFELSQVRRISHSQDLQLLLDSTTSRVRSSAEGLRQATGRKAVSRRRNALPIVSSRETETEYSLATEAALAKALTDARDPNRSPEERLTEVTTSLVLASNLNDAHALRSAYQAVNAVRHAPGIPMFDVHRADLIYSVSTGDRNLAIVSAGALVEASRSVQDVQLACKGLRNAAEAFSSFGEYGRAQAALHESRSLAVALEYALHIAKADVRLANLAILQMDKESASAYINSARSIAESNSLRSPLLIADLSLFGCWASVIVGNNQEAAKSARQMARCVRGPQQGTANYSLLSARLSTFRGKKSKELLRDFEVLRGSISSHAHYPLEQYSLAALLLVDREASLDVTLRSFVSAQLPRIVASGCAIWPFLSELLMK